MRAAKAGPVRLSFNTHLRVEFHGATVTSDAGLLLPRELDERLGLGALPDLFRQSIYSRLAGYEDNNDAERVAEDPTFRMLASRERMETSVALISTLHWFGVGFIVTTLTGTNRAVVHFYNQRGTAEQ